MTIAETDTIVMLGMGKYNHHQRYALAVLFLLAAMVLNSPFLAPSGHAQPVSAPATVAYCGDTVVAPGITLSQNVLTPIGGDCPGNGLIIGANNLVLNCNGYSITGPGPSINAIGISLNGYTGVTIENCDVSLFNYGIELASSSNNETFSGNTANNNAGAGFSSAFGTSSNFDTFIGNTADNDSVGFYFDNFSNNVFTGNAADNEGVASSNTNPGDGFLLIQSANNDTFIGNTANNDAGGGFLLGNPSNNDTFIGNTANNSGYGSTPFAFSLRGSSNTLTRNIADNGAIGFALASDHYTLTQNTANNNTVFGFFLPSNNDNLNGNTADNNGRMGFDIISSNSIFTQNTADNNYYWGFYSETGSNNTFTGNTANNNAGSGFADLISNNTFTGNTASYNAQYGFLDPTSGSGTSGTGNTYMTDTCTGDTLGGSIPTGLCSAALTDFTITASPTTINVNAGSAGTATIAIAAVNGFSGIVSLSADNTACSVSPTSVTGSGSATLTCTFTSAQIPTVTVTGTSGSLSHTASIMFNVASTTTGGCGTGCTVTVSSDATVTNFTSDSTQIGFTASGQSGTTAFANATIPKSAVPNISLLQATINGTLVTPTITSDSTNYYVYVTFTFHSVFVIHVVFVPQDFTIASAPTTLTVNAGTPGISIITVAPVDGFTGTVMLTASFSPASGLVCSVSPTVVTGGSGNSTLTCSGTAGIYTVTVTGTSGTISHTATIAVDIIDFTLTASPASITMVQGSSGTSYVTIASEGGSAGMVTLTVNSPTGLTAGLNPSLISMSGTSALTIGSLFPTTVPGTYFLNVTGTSGSLTHSVLISVTITSATAKVPPPFLTQSTWDHRFSLSKYSNVQTFKFGVKSNSTDTTIYFSVTITGVDGNGASGFTLTSQVSTLAPNKNLAGLTMSQTFSPSQVGETFTFQVTLHWGTTATSEPSQLPYASVATNGALTSGSFTVLA